MLRQVDRSAELIWEMQHGSVRTYVILIVCSTRSRHVSQYQSDSASAFEEINGIGPLSSSLQRGAHEST
jgi:hypothetical protein